MSNNSWQWTNTKIDGVPYDVRNHTWKKWQEEVEEQEIWYYKIFSPTCSAKAELSNITDSNFSKQEEVTEKNLGEKNMVTHGPL